MTTTDEKQIRLIYLLGVIEESVSDARLAAASGQMTSTRLALRFVPEYASAADELAQAIERERSEASQ